MTTSAEICLGCGKPVTECPRAECLDDLIEVVRLACGCISVNGQGHLPYNGEPCANAVR